MFARYVLAAAAALIAGPAMAQVTISQPFTTTKNAPMYTDLGIGVLAGGGTNGYVDGDIAGATNVGGFGEVRAVVGTRWYVGGEAFFDYGAGTVDADVPETTLTRSNLGANLRLQYPVLDGDFLWEPFAFGGASWTRFDRGSITQDLPAIPAGAGLALSYSGLMIEARFTYLSVLDEDPIEPLIAIASAADNLDSWNAGLTVGVEL